MKDILGGFAPMGAVSLMSSTGFRRDIVGRRCEGNMPRNKAVKKIMSGQDICSVECRLEWRENDMPHAKIKVNIP